MKTTFLKIIALACVCTFIISCSSKEEQKQFTVAEYEAAAKHMDRDLYKLVYNQVSGSNFIDNKKLVYSTTNKEGKKYYLVDVEAKTKKLAFNHEKLAESLSKELDTKLEANSLSLYNVVFADDLKSFEFRTYRQDFTFQIETNTLSKKASKFKKASRNETVSPNGKLAAYIDNFNLWVRNLLNYEPIG